MSNPKRIKCYDSGDQHLDRYTVLYLDIPESNGDVGGRGMSTHPTSPQGFGQWLQAKPGRHLGKAIGFDKLPPDCQSLVRSDLRSFKENAT